MGYRLSTALPPQFEDSNGDPLASGTLEFYLAGTATPTPIYFNSAGSSSANTVTLDSLGMAANGGTRVGLYFDDTITYDIVIKDSTPSTIQTISSFKVYEDSANTVRVYETVAAMVAATDLSIGDHVSTLGYTTIGDGGNNEYDIVAAATGTDDGGEYIDLATHQALGLFPNKSYNVKQWGAVGDGATDDTSAIQAAIDALGENSTIIFPTGIYNVTSQVLVASDRVNLVGEGTHVTRILFSPTANASCFAFKKSPAAVINQCGIRKMHFYSTDSTYTKVAIDIYDFSIFEIEEVSITGSVVVGSGGYWRESATASSIGIRTNGREALSCRNVHVYADKPVYFANNSTAGATIDGDHFNFHNWYSSAAENPHFTMESGVTLTQFSWTGYQAWVQGEGGIYWVDATSPGSSNGFVLNNVRYENPTDATTYFIHIDVASALQNLNIRGGQFGNTAGVYLRNVNGVRFDDTWYSDSSREALNVDGTVYPIRITNAYWQTGSTATVSGLDKIEHRPNATSMPLPSDGLYTLAASASYNWEVSGTIAEDSVSVANDGVMSLGTSQQRGFVFIVTSDDASAIYQLMGATANTIEVADPSGLFSASSGTASSYNVYWSAGNSRYELENKRGGARNIKVFRVGTGQGF